MHDEDIALGPTEALVGCGGVSTYFIQARDGGPIKIGKCDFGTVRNRLQSLQTGNPQRLVITGILVGDREREMHLRFRHLRIGGEWFRAAPELAVMARAKQDVDADSTAVDQAWADGFRRGWIEAGREMSDLVAENAAEQVRRLIATTNFENLAATGDHKIAEFRPHHGHNALHRVA